MISHDLQSSVLLKISQGSFAALTASLLATRLGDGKNYAGSRDFAASTGLVPLLYSTDGKTTLMCISKRGDKNLRRLLVQCALANKLARIARAVTAHQTAFSK